MRLQSFYAGRVFLCHGSLNVLDALLLRLDDGLLLPYEDGTEHQRGHNERKDALPRKDLLAVHHPCRQSYLHAVGERPAGCKEEQQRLLQPCEAGAALQVTARHEEGEEQQG